MSNDLKGLIEQLMERVAMRANADPAESWTAQLLKGDDERLVKKWGEEAMELAIAAITASKKQTPASRQRVIEESADALYHLLVLWHKLSITPAMVATELQQRTQQSGIAEKKLRKK